MNLAAGRLGKLANGDDGSHGNPSALVDYSTYFARLFGKSRVVVVLGQQKNKDVVRGRMCGPNASRRRAAKLNVRVLRQDQFDVLREMVLAGDEQDFLDAPCDEQFALVDRSQVTGVKVSVRST